MCQAANSLDDGTFCISKKQDSVENLTAVRFMISHIELNQSPVTQYKHKSLFFIPVAALLTNLATLSLSLLGFLFISRFKWHNIAMAVKI